jgi:hypothetical protein
MTTNYKIPLLLSCLGISCVGSLIFTPAAKAGYCEDLYPESGGRRSSSYPGCLEREGNRQFNRNLDQQIQNTRPTGDQVRGAAGNVFSFIFTLRPSGIYDNGGFGYGVQSKIPFGKNISLRTSYHIQPDVNTFDIGGTYSFGEPRGIRPFVGAGTRARTYGSNYTGSRDGNSGVYASAGVDVPLGSVAGVSARVVQPFSGGSTEVQSSIGLFTDF